MHCEVGADVQGVHGMGMGHGYKKRIAKGVFLFSRLFVGIPLPPTVER